MSAVEGGAEGNCERAENVDEKASSFSSSPMPESGTAVLEGHPYDFHVSGPRNISSPNWRDLIRSSWKDPNYRRMVIACFVQAVYLLELDRQDGKEDEEALAPHWWKPFKYKLTRTLVDERDGSIYGAVLEWDRAAALADFVVIRPSGAPRAVLALRGTILKKPTARRDLEDDLRFLAWESLKGSVRYGGALKVLNELVDAYGGGNVCVGGHSLGAGFALQIGKALAKRGVFVDCHLFNPPSVSLSMSLKGIGEKAGHLWRKLSRREEEFGGEDDRNKRLCTPARKWVPHLYVNNSDYICCHYNSPLDCSASGEKDAAPSTAATTAVVGKATVEKELVAKLFVMSKGPRRFLEAHGLQQWWSDGMELQQALHHSKLIDRQLRSLYTPNSPSLPPK